MENTRSIEKTLERQRTKKAIEHLLGIIEGIIADNNLHDLEIKMLSTWISANAENLSEWPGTMVMLQMQEVLADGIITEAERAHLLQLFSELIASTFWQTGSASPEVTTLPVNDTAVNALRDTCICMTGEFSFGTRAACHKITIKAGANPVDNVTKSVNVLVIGSRVSGDWAHTSFGRKIQKAQDMKTQGHPIHIISENRWIELIAQP